MNKRRFLKIVLLTILFYRITTYVIIFFWGKTSWWHGIYTDQWNHYQLGILLLTAGIVFKKLSSLKKYLIYLFAFGWGMIIDEVADIIKLFQLYPLPSDFRDSFPDLVLIAITFLMFAFIVYFLDKNQKP